MADATDQQICCFAGKYGQLGDRAREPLNHWREQARLARALLRFTAEQLSDGRGKDEDWSTICQFRGCFPLSRSGLHKAEQLAIAAGALNRWHAQMRGHSILAMAHGQLQLRPAANNLLAVLVLQIAHVMARADQSSVCSNCRGPFTPKRPLSHGVRQYCEECRQAKIPQRDASRDWRRRVSQQKL